MNEFTFEAFSAKVILIPGKAERSKYVAFNSDPGGKSSGYRMSYSLIHQSPA
jgi:hypothetical protein